MDKCCNGKVTRYCPDCGADLRGNPLAALRHHVAKNASDYAQRAKRNNGLYVAAEKWAAWLAALDELLERNKEI